MNVEGGAVEPPLRNEAIAERRVGGFESLQACQRHEKPQPQKGLGGLIDVCTD